MTEVYAFHTFLVIHPLFRAGCAAPDWPTYSLWPGVAKVPSYTDQALAVTNGTAAALGQCNADCRCRSFSAGVQQAMWSLVCVGQLARRAGWVSGHMLLVRQTA